MSATEALARAVLEAARARGVLIATAESCTGGLLGAALTEFPGSSDVYERGFITYSNKAKVEMLGVPEPVIAARGAVSEEVARAMAEGALARSRAALAVSITGVAGPGASERKPEGRVCFDLAGLGRTCAETVEFGPLGREKVRHRAVLHALALLRDALAPQSERGP